MYTYKDFITGKTRRTRGKFHRWQRGGPLNAWGVIFRNPRSILFVPEYLLTPETKAQLPPKPKSEGVTRDGIKSNLKTP